MGGRWNQERTHNSRTEVYTYSRATVAQKSHSAIRRIMMLSRGLVRYESEEPTQGRTTISWRPKKSYSGEVKDIMALLTMEFFKKL